MDYLREILSILLYDPDHPLLFNSGLFLALFLGFFGLYVFLSTRPSFRQIRIVYVILFSLYFYYKCSGYFFILIIFSTVVDFYLGKFLYQSSSDNGRRALLILSLLINLGLLAYFKYTNFFIGILNDLQSRQLETMDIFLPVGISFYTFQTMSYTIDIYRRKLVPTKSFLDFAFFVTFFPQLVAGPIVRASSFLPQLKLPMKMGNWEYSRAIFFICSGLFKKAIISDYISINFVDRVFESPSLYTGFENLMGIYGYALQIYCDFSGYSDMAIGIALLLGFRLPINFDSPYKSRSFQEFWRRWHISLSTWLRDYLYISMGGNRKGVLRTYLHLMVTMLLGGLWHGPHWKFVIWGALHGILLALERLLKPLGERLRFKNAYQALPIAIGNALRGLTVFHLVCLGWVFFRAESWEKIAEMFSQITTAFRFDFIIPVILAYEEVFILLGVGYLLHFLPKRWEKGIFDWYVDTQIWVKPLSLAVVIWLVMQTMSAEIQPFIYFQF